MWNDTYIYIIALLQTHLPVANVNAIVRWDDVLEEKQLHEGWNCSGKP